MVDVRGNQVKDKRNLKMRKKKFGNFVAVIHLQYKLGDVKKVYHLSVISNNVHKILNECDDLAFCYQDVGFESKDNGRVFTVVKIEIARFHKEVEVAKLLSFNDISAIYTAPIWVSFFPVDNGKGEKIHGGTLHIGKTSKQITFAEPEKVNVTMTGPWVMGVDEYIKRWD